MSSIATSMRNLQYGDSFFPSGATSFSWGLEALAEGGIIAGADDVKSFLMGQLHARWGQFDRAIVSATHRASGILEEVASIDDLVEIQTPVAELRSASRRMGEAMLSVFARLGVDSADPYRRMVRESKGYGHVTAMQGFLWARVGISESDAIALSAHSFSIGLLGAGIRLGRLTHIEAQHALVEAQKEVASIVAMPVPTLSQLSSFGLEAEIAVMRHAKIATRVFAN